MPRNTKKIKTLDLFAGCGGLTEGFEMTGRFDTIAGVEWDKASRDTLAKRLTEAWGYKDAEERILLWDLQETEKLFSGWDNHSKYGSHSGLDALVKKYGSIDLIVGGPPCQAYSVAGRIRDEDGMNNDYRNYLFEKYAAIVNRLQPHAFIFENVPGMLSARPGGIPIVERVRQTFKEIGYSLVEDIEKYAQVDAAEFGVPQNRRRVVLFGIRDESFEQDPQELLCDFYTNTLTSHKTRKKTVAEAIFDLPKFAVNKNKKEKNSHIPATTNILNHSPRFHNTRDIAIFKELALDLRRTKRKYASAEALKKLYTEKTGKVSSVHKYYVLEPNKQSNTIVSHLHKDGLRHIHPDPDQARSITVREAARLQSFPDDFEFLGSMGDQYKMIGNAVPPLLAQAVAESVASFLDDNLVEQETSRLWSMNSTS